MAQVNYQELKKGGFMKQIQKDRFSLRLRIVGGHITAEQLKKVYEVAQQYGQGYIHMTSRQSIEIPFIKLEDIDTVKKALAEAGVQPGACGPRVRTITACQGATICPHGLIDTTALAKEFDERYYARELPHKFKLGITGCRNNCLKAEENDLGVRGGTEVKWDAGKCNFCGLCEAVCSAKVIQVNQQDKKLSFKDTDCIFCGKCVKVCPAGAWQGKSGFIVYFGGLYGKQIAIGKQLEPRLLSNEELHKVVEATLEFFKQYGKQGERFGNTLDRVGWDLFRRQLAAAL
ncbi:MAG TPA: 4Fe-4S binding protein [Methylomusa anaerophila]|uniref:Anaerobic sulfite reductase subunit C n=1 Tax=Methylomusa anaerophila TaxID=1930071 RepID=A0A348ALH7_9FIRM|nr:4Fe-4S binding protein [Methylomusa anaerophila]BBB91925.1 anaerobic sulfite reductase subunit C [Methylomusa anaerophila]HML88062.1 4Fe-4S binding protein [Methylomusa anaerophila]